MNMMKYCPECYKELPPNSPTCPFCDYKTGNGDPLEQPAPGFLKTPKTDSFIPPEQTMLSLLLLVIFFWGINITATILPIFLDIGTLRNILIAGISSQVLTRIMIGVWATQEQSLKKGITTTQKVGSFALALIPVAAIISFLQAARTMVRKDKIAHLSIGSISAAILMSILLFGTREGVAAFTRGERINSSAQSTQNPSVAALYIDSTDLPPTATTRTYVSGCRNPSSVVAEEEGEIIEICGEVTNYGQIDCKTCPLGFYSFIKIDHSFQIVSYDWKFSFAWKGRCLLVSDAVELLGERPVFVFGKGDGYAGTECITDKRGELICEGGKYFQDYYSCGPR